MKMIEEIEELKEQFISQLKPLKIYLFGSFANATYAEESDFDFYIIVSNEVKELKDLTTQAYRSIRKIKKRSVDIIIGTESTFENKKNSPSVENEVMKKGYCYMNQKVKKWVDMTYSEMGENTKLLPHRY